MSIININFEVAIIFTILIKCNSKSSFENLRDIRIGMISESLYFLRHKKCQSHLLSTFDFFVLCHFEIVILLTLK